MYHKNLQKHNLVEDIIFTFHARFHTKRSSYETFICRNLETWRHFSGATWLYQEMTSKDANKCYDYVFT